MKLDQWIRKSGKTRSEVAQALGVSRASVTRWCAGDRRPEPYYVKKISTLSADKVGLLSWGHMSSNPTQGAKLIWAWLFDEGLTITQGAIRLGIPPMTFRGWVQNGTVPNGDNLAKLSDGIGSPLSPDDFKDHRK